MGLNRIALLLRKDLVHGSKSFIFVFAVVTPLLTTLMLSLLFGRLLAQKPRLGLVDEAGSQLAARVVQVEAVSMRTYGSAAELQRAVESGQVDIGLVIPAGFEQSLKAGESLRMEYFIWGESRIQSRMTVAAAVSNSLVEALDLPTPVDVTPRWVGGVAVSWYDRLLPLLVLLSVLMSGILMPATALVDEKQKMTLRALLVTPASLSEVMASKALYGVLLSLFVAMLTLVLNRAWGNQPGLLLGVLLLSAMLATALGLVLGMLVKDLNSLLAAIKGLVVLLYATGILPLFPQIPEWIGKLFPTYYIFDPILRIGRDGAGWAQVAPEVLVLAGLVLAGYAVVGLVGRRMQVV